MPYILHIDTSGNTGTIALSNDGIILAVETTDDTRNQSAAINVMIGQVLGKSGIAIAQLNAVAVCGGPGSYTGLRIGMATAKGLCYALDIPMIADNKLALLAGARQSEYGNKHPLYITMLVAREKEYFITAMSATGENIITPQHFLEANIALPEAGDKYVITDVAGEKVREIISNALIIDNHITIDLDYWAIAVKKAFNSNHFVNLATTEPFYLKEVYTHK